MQPRIQREPILTALFNLLTQSLTASFYAMTTAGSPVLSGVSALTGNLWLGLPVFGSGIAQGSYIQSVMPQLTLSQPATANSSIEVPLLAGLQTTGRRLIPWSKVAAQPALFLRHTGDDFLARRPRLPGRVELEAEIWLYSDGGDDPDLAPEIPLNALIDAVAETLEPPIYGETQTLGIAPLVTHCWLEGRGEIYPGDLGGSAVALLPIKILVPGVSPTGGPTLG